MIVLYNPPSSATRKPVLPMSLLALGALLEGEHDYAIVDGNLAADPLGALDRTIRATGADLLGVTVMPGPQLAAAVPHCRALKARYPNLEIVWGGYFPTQYPDVCRRAPYVDYVIRGHGEVVFRALADARRRGERPVPRAGLVGGDGESTLADGGLAPIPHPDRLPDFPYHRVAMERYLRPTFLGQRTIAHHSSYGCPFLCNFCAVVNMVGGRWLAQSAAHAASVVHRLVEEYGVDAVELYDNNFFVHEARTAEFAARIRPLGVSWWGEARVDTLLRYADSTWRLMRDSGLKMVFMGAESGSDETLRRMNKGGTAATDNTLAIAEKTARLGIVPEFSFIVGCPPEPIADTEQTLAFIRQVKRINARAEIILYLYTPVPLAGELYEQAQQHGFRFPETLDEWIAPGWLAFSGRRGGRVPWVDATVHRRVLDFQRVLNAYYPTATDRHLRGWRRSLLRLAGAWRYHLRLYRWPAELRALQRLVPYQRPETAGF